MNQFIFVAEIFRVWKVINFLVLFQIGDVLFVAKFECPINIPLVENSRTKLILL